MCSLCPYGGGVSCVGTGVLGVLQNVQASLWLLFDVGSGKDKREGIETHNHLSVP